MDAQQKDTMTVEAAGKRLGLGRGSAYAAAASGAIPVLRIGRRILVPIVAFNAMLAATAKGN